MAYPVKWYSSSMQGAANLGDTAEGALTALIKSILVTGFGTLTINSLSFDTAKGWAVATFTGGHAYLQDSVVQVDGVSPAAYNGEHRVMLVTSTQVWFELDGGNPGAAGSGASMTMKVAPLGWSLTHESGDGKVAIYRPANISESGNVSLRIDNSAFSGWSGATYMGYLAKVQMVEDVTDINTFTLIHDARWPATARYSDKRWDFIGDSQLFYFLPAYATASYQSMFAFGYIKSVRPGDRYHAISMNYSSLVADDSNRRWNIAAGGSFTSYYNQSLAFEDSSYRAMARPYSQLFGTTGWFIKGLFTRFGTGLPVPNGPDNGLYMSVDPIMILESGNHLRGYLPGLVCPFGSVSAWHRKNFSGLPALPNKLLRFIYATYIESTVNGGPTMMGFDITGPWR
ncbi:hypothetical protein JD501_04040 [Aeromonas hydrophila]|uniref:hypothetical protein n=1 Tax=Aeromonas hydrophila TaxID=644 RepID=UPI0019201A0B|nr:hypothetical protein [Aeromonas hydrophila]MBL0432398.1 hypothetical protein [Aeromonas hydrophila]MBL0468369.1 hypothetical protein [Aeromonas hydrophila]